MGGAVEHISGSVKGQLAEGLKDGRVACTLKRGRAAAQSREEGLTMTRFGAPGTGWWQCY